MVKYLPLGNNIQVHLEAGKQKIWEHFPDLIVAFCAGILVHAIGVWILR